MELLIARTLRMARKRWAFWRQSADAPPRAAHPPCRMDINEHVPTYGHERSARQWSIVVGPFFVTQHSANVCVMFLLRSIWPVRFVVVSLLAAHAAIGYERLVHYANFKSMRTMPSLQKTVSFARKAKCLFCYVLPFISTLKLQWSALHFLVGKHGAVSVVLVVFYTHTQWIDCSPQFSLARYTTREQHCDTCKCNATSSIP
jgi:hypothetical protein